MSDLVALIERLSAATEGSRELDAEIDAALRVGKPSLPAWAWNNFPTWRARPDGLVEVVHSNGSVGLHWQPQAFSTSIDAALSLLEPMDVDEWDLWCDCGHWFITLKSLQAGGVIKEWKADGPECALALCEAIMRARSDLEAA